MRFALGITLYNPSSAQILNITELEKCFDKVFLFDNSEPGYQKPNYPHSEKIEILTNGNNMGLSFAFNSIINKCQDFNFLCTMDQDSKFLRGDITKLQEYIESIDTNTVGIIAPYVDYGYGAHVLEEKIENKRWVITSGSFVNLEIIRKFDLRYDENYFIDKFEIDMCEQFKSVGCSVLMYHNSVLHQMLGENSGHKHPNHSSLRHYYLFRNRLYFNSKWYPKGNAMIKDILQTIRHIYLILLYESNKVDKIKMLKHSYVDFRKNKMGKKVLIK